MKSRLAPASLLATFGLSLAAHAAAPGGVIGPGGGGVILPPEDPAVTCQRALDDKLAALTAAGVNLGAATAPMAMVDVFCWRAHQNGLLYSTAHRGGSGAPAVYGPVLAAYIAQGRHLGTLGRPMTDPARLASGETRSSFLGGIINAHPLYGAFPVWSAVSAQWQRQNVESRFGPPLAAPADHGRRRRHASVCSTTASALVRARARRAFSITPALASGGADRRHDQSLCRRQLRRRGHHAEPRHRLARALRRRPRGAQRRDHQPVDPEQRAGHERLGLSCSRAATSPGGTSRSPARRIGAASASPPCRPGWTTAPRVCCWPTTGRPRCASTQGALERDRRRPRSTHSTPTTLAQSALERRGRDGLADAGSTPRRVIDAPRVAHRAAHAHRLPRREPRLRAHLQLQRRWQRPLRRVAAPAGERAVHRGRRLRAGHGHVADSCDVARLRPAGRRC
jgi:hypothetical protein